MSDSAHQNHPEVGHVIGIPILLATASALLVLTLITVEASKIDLGAMNIWLALFIAVIKASLVVLFFMHLKYDAPFNAIVFIVSITLVVLFIGFALMDTHHYAEFVFEGQATGMEYEPYEGSPTH